MKDEDQNHDFPQMIQIELLSTTSKPTKKTKGTDEMNLAEFPICSLGKRDENNLKIEFHDNIYDKISKKNVNRKLSVIATKEYGLPNWIDEEVIVALIQISKNQGFPEEVKFSRYELLGELKWSFSGQSYKRLIESLDRWTSITLDYQNAWTKKLKGELQWVNAKFHIIDHFEIYNPQDPHSPDNCMIRWGSHIQRSFKEKFIKQLDVDKLRKFKKPSTKRLYRFLDKRLYHKANWEFPLKYIANEKIGISRNAAVGQIKQRLNTAIKELVEDGYLKPLPNNERYLKARVGEWIVVFNIIKPKEEIKENEIKIANLPEIQQLLISRGVTPDIAKLLDLNEKYSDNYIKTKVEHIDYLVGMGKSTTPRNPPGWLIEAIKIDFGVPTGFLSYQEKVKQAYERQKREENQKLELEKRKIEIAAINDRWNEQRKRAKNYWKTLTETKQAKIKQAAKDRIQEMGHVKGVGYMFNEEQKIKYTKDEIIELLIKEMKEELIVVPEK